MWTSDSTWLSRLRLLDDLPLSGRGADLFELEPHVRLLAEAILSCEGPLVVHVDGTWGRGKTSFCRLVEEELTRTGRRDDAGRSPATCSRYVASDDRGAAASSLLHAIAKAVAGPDDPEEAARIVRQWGADEELSAMRVDGFATWLGHELGRSKWTPPQEAIEIPLGTGRVLRRDWVVNRRRSAVVFVDDLDRCPGERVVEILDAIRSYVACPGLVFVIAADRRLIERAFEQIVAREADLRHVDASEAMEKYVHRRVELPSFRGFRGALLSAQLRRLQLGLLGDDDARQPRLLSIPAAELADGIAWPLVTNFGASLTPRRLKRILNDFAHDMAHFVDEAGLAFAFDAEESWKELWAKDGAIEPNFALDSAHPSAAQLRGYFIGRALIRVAEHMWPSLFARLTPGDDEFSQRSERLLALARIQGQWIKDAARRMRDELLLGLDPVDTTPLRVRRQLCGFMAVLLEAAREASGWQAVEELAMDAAVESEEQAYRETLPQQQQARFEVQKAPVPLGRETYLSPQSKSLSLSADLDADDDDDEFEAGDEVAELVEMADAESEGELEAARKGAAMVEADVEADAFAELDQLLWGWSETAKDSQERQDLIVDALFRLEVLVNVSRDDSRLVKYTTSVLDLVGPGDINTHFQSLWSTARVAAQRDLDQMANQIYSRLEASPLSSAGSFDSWVQVRLEYLSLLIERQPTTASLETANAILTFCHQRLDPSVWSEYSDLWLNAARLRSLQPGQDFGWSERLDGYIDDLGQAFQNEAGRENTRRYLLMLRAAGRDDPRLAMLLGPRATLVHAERGDPEIIEALADILVRRGDADSYAHARNLYLRLRGTARWTPEVLHNLATAKNALDPSDDSAGAHWLEAYRRAPDNTVIRRSLRRFLLSRKFVKEAQAVSRGELLPADFAPFTDTTPEEPAT